MKFSLALLGLTEANRMAEKIMRGFNCERFRFEKIIKET